MKCEKCGEQCEPIPCKSRPESSEWYCTPCHKSYDMSEEDFLYWAQNKR